MARINTRRALATCTLVAALTVTACSGPEEGDSESTSQEVTWSDESGFQLPSGEAGPAETDGAAPAGFSHDVFGATLAAAHLSIALDTADEKTFGDVLASGTVDDEGRSEWAGARAGLTIGQVRPNQVPTLTAWAGESDGETAQVFLYWEQYDGSITEQRRDLVWQDDDWKLKLPANPQAPQLRAVEGLPDSATEFTPAPTSDDDE